MRRLTPVVTMLLCFFTVSFSQSNLHPAGLVKPDDRLQVIHRSAGGSVVAGRFRAGREAVDETTGKYRVIVYSNSIQDALQIGVQPRTVTQEFFTAEATLDQISRLSKLGSVRRVTLAKKYKPLLDLSVPEIHADQLQNGKYNGTSYTGKHVILGFIDTGIDWTHLDFRTTDSTKKSRVLWIWDQTTTGGSPSPFTYGTEYTQAQINAELGITPPNIVKEVDDDGHGTHVAGIAAGNGSSSISAYIGVAPQADIVFVKTTFFDTDIIDGITYIVKKAAAAGEPFVINLSLGSQQGAHDGTDPMEIDIDGVLSSSTGSAVVIAAGNDGTNPIHADGSVSQGSTLSDTFSIPTYTPISGAQNDYVSFDMWYQGSDKLTVSVTSPGGSVVSAVAGDSVGIDTKTGDGAVQIYNAIGGPNPLDSSNECTIDLFDNEANKPPKAGTWEITVTGASVKQGGAFDIWLYDASMTGNNGSSPVFTSGYTFRKLVGVPGTSKKAITVGSYVTRYTWYSIDGSYWAFAKGDRTGNYSTFSSMGPTRDGRQKPDVCAPGEVIFSALSKDTSPAPDSSLIAADGKHIVMEGTSMATPHVAGVAALLLQAKPSSTSDQLKSAMTGSARRDSITGSSVTPQWGYGKIDATGSMGTVLSSVRSAPNTVPRNFSLEENYPNPFNPSTEIRYTLPENFKGNVSLTIFDVLGKKVAALVNQEQAGGTFSATWNASYAASGVYFYALRAGNFLAVKKMVLMK